MGMMMMMAVMMICIDARGGPTKCLARPAPCQLIKSQARSEGGTRGSLTVAPLSGTLPSRRITQRSCTVSSGAVHVFNISMQQAALTDLCLT